MAIRQFRDNSGAPIDAHFEVRSGNLVLHSRGGTKGTAQARNTDYQAALRLMLERFRRSGLEITDAWVDSSRVGNLPIERRRVLFPDDARVSTDELYARLSRRMASVGRDPALAGSGGNRTKRLRFSFGGAPSDTWIAHVAGRGDSGNVFNRNGLLSTSAHDCVTEDHVYFAVEQLSAGTISHAFSHAGDFDVVADNGTRLASKVVYGVAASEALGLEISPTHFEEGEGTRCFKVISDAGYLIVPKGATVPATAVYLEPVQRSAMEGHRRLVTHLRRERHSGLARDKKQAFREEHGVLFCERCKMRPDVIYGADRGDACIEVHHTVPIGAEPGFRETNLEDLKCLCANCHRVEHWKIRRASK
ncbi:MAG: hypothetical protein F4Y86_01085 [Gammaproteobacteria bacterium]|nr:hypothetical protein [Gammaproteobacteria bacterium]